MTRDNAVRYAMQMFGPYYGRPSLYVDFDLLQGLDRRRVEDLIIYELARSFITEDASLYPWSNLVVFIGGKAAFDTDSLLPELLISDDDGTEAPLLERFRPDIVVDMPFGVSLPKYTSDVLRVYPGTVTVVVSAEEEVLIAETAGDILSSRIGNTYFQFFVDGTEDSFLKVQQSLDVCNELLSADERPPFITRNQVCLVPRTSNVSLVGKLALRHGFTYSVLPIAGLFCGPQFAS